MVVVDLIGSLPSAGDRVGREDETDGRLVSIQEEEDLRSVPFVIADRSECWALEEAVAVGPDLWPVVVVNALMAC